MLYSVFMGHLSNVHPGAVTGEMKNGFSMSIGYMKFFI